jgi:large subunit ribosomal protein L2
MGKRIQVQRRGRGAPTFIASKKRKRGAVRHPHPKVYQDKLLEGEIIDIEHERGRSAPLARVKYADGKKEYMIAPEGISVGDTVSIGLASELKIGNTLKLREIPEGTSIYNIESQPGDGGKFVRAGGTYATVVTRSPSKIMIKLPSGKMKAYLPDCRATIGVVAGGGRIEKPFVKAGNRYYHQRAKNHKYPVVRGVAMIAASHPHGGGQKQHIGKKSSCVSRNAPPGRKVGLIAAKRSGKKKR